jgi:hypothetical protein
MNDSYSVTRTRGCKLIRGPVPVDEFVALVNVWSKREEGGEEWIVDALLANHVDATFVLGPKVECYAWRADLGLPTQMIGETPLDRLG